MSGARFTAGSPTGGGLSKQTVNDIAKKMADIAVAKLATKQQTLATNRTNAWKAEKIAREALKERTGKTPVTQVSFRDPKSGAWANIDAVVYDKKTRTLSVDEAKANMGGFKWEAETGNGGDKKLGRPCHLVRGPGKRTLLLGSL